MRGRINLRALCERALSESLDVRTMTALAGDIVPNYDIYERSGFPRSIAIPNKDVAHQNVLDMQGEHRLLELIARRHIAVMPPLSRVDLHRRPTSPPPNLA